MLKTKKENSDEDIEGEICLRKLMPEVTSVQQQLMGLKTPVIGLTDGTNPRERHGRTGSVDVLEDFEEVLKRLKEYVIYGIRAIVR